MLLILPVRESKYLLENPPPSEVNPCSTTVCVSVASHITNCGTKTFPVPSQPHLLPKCLRKPCVSARGFVPISTLPVCPWRSSSSLDVRNDQVPVSVPVKRKAQDFSPTKNISVRRFSALGWCVNSTVARTSKALPLHVGLTMVHSRLGVH